MNADLPAIVRMQLQRGYERVQKCLADLSEDETRRSPFPRLAPVVWQVGHLTFYDSLFGQRAGRGRPAPDGFEPLFKAGTGGPADYPPIGQVWEAFDRANSTLLEIAGIVDLTRPVEGPMYANVGEMLIYASVHRGYHIGKMTTLRALLNKPILFGPPPPSA
jgi:DinB family protein